MASYTQNDQALAWWREKKNSSTVAQMVFAMVNRLNRSQSYRRESNITSMRLYGGQSFLNMSPYSYASTSVQQLQDDRPRYNVVSSCVDTVFSRISKNKPRITVLTSGADDSTQKRAQKLSKFVLGMFIQTGLYEQAQQCFKDGCIFDVGAMKLYRDAGQIKVERVFPNELYVDDADAFYGRPSHIYQVKYVLKSVLKELYPRAAGHIDQASGKFETDSGSTGQDTENYAAVVEAWHLKSGPDADDGRHTISIDAAGGYVLLDEPYDRTYLPFVFSMWSKPLVGFWGQSLASRLRGKQIEINKMLQVIQKSFALGAAFKVFLERGSQVSPQHLNNDIGSIVYYTGAKPDYTVPQTVHQEFFQHLRWLIQSSYEESGISQMSATSKKPAGLDAAVAIREAQDVESERFAIVAQGYENMFLQAAEQFLDLAKEIDEEHGEFSVVAESKKFLETIDWKEVAIERNEMMMQLFPVSMLPQQPEGRLNMVMDMINAGFIDRETGLALLNFPDLETEMELRLAAVNDIKQAASDILDNGMAGYNPPEPFQNLEWGIKYFQSTYLRARTKNADEEVLDALRKWMVTADAMVKKAKEPAPQALPSVPTNVEVGSSAKAPGMVSMPEEGVAPEMPVPQQP